MKAFLTGIFLCVCVFKALLKQLQEDGTKVPSENLGKLLEEAQRMVNEMENRDFTPQKTAAEKERDEAKKCKEMSSRQRSHIMKKSRYHCFLAIMCVEKASQC